jgi:hypothetical protein
MNIFNLRFLILNSFFVLFCLGCNIERKVKDVKTYKYFDGLNSFYIENHSFDLRELSGVSYLLIVPVGGCSSCIDESFEMALKFKETSNFYVTVFSDNDKSFELHSNKLDDFPSRQVIVETEGRHRLYETGVFSPVLIVLNNGVLLSFDELNIDNISRIFHEKISNN